MPTYGQAALVVATTQLGIKEDPPSSNWGPPSKYMKNLGHGPEPWCADFTEWCLEQIGWTRGDWNVSYVPSWVQAATQCRHGMRALKFPFEQPQPGDLVTYDWEKDGLADHIGIYEKPNGVGAFDAIEGNTSPTNQSNGGEVMRRTRSTADVRVFIRLPEMPKPTIRQRLAASWPFGPKSLDTIQARLREGYQGDIPNKYDRDLFNALRDHGFGAASARVIVKTLRKKKT